MKEFFIKVKEMNYICINMEKFQNEEAKKQIVMCSLLVKSVFICRADHCNGDCHYIGFFNSRTSPHRASSNWSIIV